MRSANEVWDTIAALVTATLQRSNSIDAETVAAELAAFRPGAIALIAAGYLDRLELTLIADSLRLTLSTASGDSAATALADENLNSVAGATSASDWRLHVPSPGSMGTLVEGVVKPLQHITTQKPRAEAKTANTQATGTQKPAPLIDLARLDPAKRT